MIVHKNLLKYFFQSQSYRTKNLTHNLFETQISMSEVFCEFSKVRKTPFLLYAIPRHKPSLP